MKSPPVQLIIARRKVVELKMEKLFHSASIQLIMLNKFHELSIRSTESHRDLNCLSISGFKFVERIFLADLRHDAFDILH